VGLGYDTHMSNPNSIIADACGANATRGYSATWVDRQK